MEKEVRRRRFLSMLFGAFAIFFTGFPHVWSIYSPYVMEKTGWTSEQTSMCFYLALLSFVFGNIFGGRIQDRSDPIRVLSAGGLIQAAGILGSAFLLLENPFPLYAAYGILHGFGQGMVYTVVLSTAQKWFPDKKGFASGVVVTANGLCGFFMAPLSRILLIKEGPEKALLTVGILMLFSWGLSVLFVKLPLNHGNSIHNVEKEGEEQGEVHQYSSKEMVRTRKFYLVACAMMCGLVSYFVVSPISQSLQIQRGVSQVAAVSAVMLGSILNAGARLTIPSLSDKIGRIFCIKAVMLVSLVTMLSLTVSDSYATTIGVMFMYGCYGGIMGSFPSLTSSIFGMRHSGENYGFVMFGVIAATLTAPALSRIIADAGYGLSVVFAVGAFSSGLALIFLFLLERELKQG